MFALTPYSGVEPVDEVVPRPLPQPVDEDEVTDVNHTPATPSGRTAVACMSVFCFTFF